MKRLLRHSAFLLILSILISVLCTGAFSVVRAAETAKYLDTPPYQPTDPVTAIVLTARDGAAIVESKTDALIAEMQRRRLLSQHADVLADMENLAIPFSFHFDYTTLLNGFSVSVQYADVERIRSLPNVETVLVAETFSLPQVYAEDAPLSDSANDMIGMQVIADARTRGKGIRIAILDTGLRVSHEAFADHGLTEGICESEVRAIVAEGAVKNGRFVSDKIPFAYDYADFDRDVADRSGHGTHVAAIAAGYAEDADRNIEFCGAAPAAQLFAMKIFGDNAETTNSSIFFKAIEDAYLLGADIINLSIGSAAGFPSDPALYKTYDDLYRFLEREGVIVCASAGNTGSQAAHSLNAMGNGYVSTDYTDYGLIASPSVYPANISVGAINNARLLGEAHTITVNGYAFAYRDNSGVDSFASMMAERGNAVEYVLIPGIGDTQDYQGIDATGKVAVVKRGGLSFDKKLAAATAAGALALVCYNNVPDQLVVMQIAHYSIPAISVPLIAGEAFIAAANENGVGTLRLDTDAPLRSHLPKTISGFSAAGPSPDLAFKPNLCAIGGNVLSAAATSDNGYVINSGTSMSSPHAAGAFAVLLAEHRAAHPEATRTASRAFVESLIESTAIPQSDTEGRLLSPRRQGAGLISVDAAVRADGYVTSPLIAMGENEAGRFSLSFTVRNLTDRTIAYRIEPHLMTDLADDTYRALGWYHNTLKTQTLVRADADAGTAGDYRCTLSCGEVLTLLAGDAATVSVDIVLTDEMMQRTKTVFPNGTYIDAFIFLRDLDEGDGASKVDLHVSAFGFFGDWEAARAMELYTSLDDPSDVRASLIAAPVSNPTGVRDINVGITELYLYAADPDSPEYRKRIGLSKNPIAPNTHPADPALCAIPVGDGARIFDTLGIDPALLRNVSRLIMLAVDEQTGALYHIEEKLFVRKTLYSDNEWKSAASFRWSTTDASEGVPSGATVAIEFYPVLATEEAAYRSPSSTADAVAYREYLRATFGEPEVRFTAHADGAPPTVSDCYIDEEQDALVVTITDDHAIASLRAADAQNAAIADIHGNAIDRIAEGEKSVTVAIDLNALGARRTFYLTVVDYASNRAAIRVEKDAQGVLHVMDPQSNNGFCLLHGQDRYFDGTHIGTVTVDELHRSIDVAIDCEPSLRSGERIVFPMGDVLKRASEAGYAASFMFGYGLTVMPNAEAVGALAEVGAAATLTVSVEEKPGGASISLLCSVGAPTRGSVCVLYQASAPESIREGDIRLFLIEGEKRQAIDGFSFGSGVLKFDTVAMQTYIMVVLDENARLAEEMAIAAQAAADAAQEKATLAAENAKAAAEALASAKDALEGATEQAELAKRALDAATAQADLAAERAMLAEAAAKDAQNAAIAAMAEAQTAHKHAKVAQDAAAQAEGALAAVVIHQQTVHDLADAVAAYVGEARKAAEDAAAEARAAQDAQKDIARHASGIRAAVIALIAIAVVQVAAVTATAALLWRIKRNQARK